MFWYIEKLWLKSRRWSVDDKEINRDPSRSGRRCFSTLWRIGYRTAGQQFPNHFYKTKRNSVFCERIYNTTIKYSISIRRNCIIMYLEEPQNQRSHAIIQHALQYHDVIHSLQEERNIHRELSNKSKLSFNFQEVFWTTRKDLRSQWRNTCCDELYEISTFVFTKAEFTNVRMSIITELNERVDISLTATTTKWSLWTKINKRNFWLFTLTKN